MAKNVKKNSPDEARQKKLLVVAAIVGVVFGADYYVNNVGGLPFLSFLSNDAGAAASPGNNFAAQSPRNGNNTAQALTPAPSPVPSDRTFADVQEDYYRLHPNPDLARADFSRGLELELQNKNTQMAQLRKTEEESLLEADVAAAKRAELMARGIAALNENQVVSTTPLPEKSSGVLYENTVPNKGAQEPVNTTNYDDLELNGISLVVGHKNQYQAHLVIGQTEIVVKDGDKLKDDSIIRINEDKRVLRCVNDNCFPIL